MIINCVLAYTMLHVYDMHLNNNVVIFSHQRRKRLENAQDFFCQDQDQDQDFYLKTKTETLGFKTKTKTCVFVLEAPRDQDLGLQNYITVGDRVYLLAA